MRSRFVVIAKITFQYPAQMLLAEHNHVIQALATDASNHPLGVWILPWALCSSSHSLNAHSLNPFLKVFTIDAVTISEKITCRFIPGNASIKCWAVHAAVGCSVILK